MAGESLLGDRLQSVTSDHVAERERMRRTFDGLVLARFEKLMRLSD